MGGRFGERDLKADKIRSEVQFTVNMTDNTELFSLGVSFRTTSELNIFDDMPLSDLDPPPWDDHQMFAASASSSRSSEANPPHPSSSSNTASLGSSKNSRSSEPSSSNSQSSLGMN